jgi:hypothetical protein
MVEQVGDFQSDSHSLHWFNLDVIHKTVSNDKDRIIPIGIWQWANKVHGNFRESGGQDRKWMK